MFDGLKIKRSAGVPVTRPVHAAIAKGNAARSQSDWALAALHYEHALARDPGLTHIWIQIGHMYKEDRVWERAVHAYAQAAKLAPTDPDVIGWLFEIAGRLGDDERRGVIAVLEANFPNAAFRTPLSRPIAVDEREVVFDVSDLVSYFARARVPTGIQRVQIEVIRSLAQDRVPPRICCVIEGRDAWVEIPFDVFMRITDIATGGDQFSVGEWVEALAALQLSLLLRDALRFGAGAVLLNLGTSWWLQNYFLQIRNAQVESGIEYVPFVHDLIPVMTPHHCVDGLVEDFVFWVTSVFAHASRFLVNSEATKRDLMTVAARLGYDVSANAVTVVRLDARFAHPAPPTNIDATLHRFGLIAQRFVLFVSTIESRKDHFSALRVWQRLMGRYGDMCPKLVCVGNDGWLNEQFYALLASDPKLGGHVVLLRKISDRELGLLYERCLFTIYPSTYEGWGLPITEALSYGKPVVAADNSSLPEAGGTLALYFKTGDIDHFTDLVEHLSFDDAYRATLSHAIAEAYRPREWVQVARQITGFVAVPVVTPVADRRVVIGRWYDLSRSRERSIWHGSGSAEVFRVGRGWADADGRGAWIKTDRAALEFDLPDGEYLDLAMLLSADAGVNYRIDMDNKAIDLGTVTDGGERWVTHRFEAKRGRTKIDLLCRLIEKSQTARLSRALCVVGFAMTRTDDRSKQAFLEAVTFDSLDRITAFRRPAEADAEVWSDQCAESFGGTRYFLDEASISSRPSLHNIDDNKSGDH